MIGSLNILEILNAHQVQYLVIGTLGAIFEGGELRTDDLDICPKLTSSNLKALGRALNELKAKEWDSRKGELMPGSDWAEVDLTIDQTWLLETPHGALDLVFKPAGTGGYQDLVRAGQVKDVEGLPVPVASLEDIVRSKETANRPKDREQLPLLRALLKKIQEKRRQEMLDMEGTGWGADIEESRPPARFDEL